MSNDEKLRKNSEEFRKNSATIYSSQWEIIKMMPKNKKIAVLEALIDYEMLGIEPKREFFQKYRDLEIFWQMSKPLIDKRIRKAENGRKGGLSEKKKKQTESKPKAKLSKPKAKLSKPKADKDKDIDLDIEDISKDISISEHSHAPLEGGARSEDYELNVPEMQEEEYDDPRAYEGDEPDPKWGWY